MKTQFDYLYKHLLIGARAFEWTGDSVRLGVLLVGHKKGDRQISVRFNRNQVIVRTKPHEPNTYRITGPALEDAERALGAKIQVELIEEEKTV